MERGGDLTRVADEGIFWDPSAPEIQAANLKEYGGGNITLPPYVVYKFEAPIYVCIETAIAMLHDGLQARQLPSFAITSMQTTLPVFILFALDARTRELICKPLHRLKTRKEK